ncbi:hypothetical protein [Billgrantia desiderata]|uniref:hypothetical protein n=1 Tax=Billgrantia desiderata TaxID=52021 RepID=UPI00190E8DE6|nr:hypothetical protein [Halomonas desiderata]
MKNIGVLAFARVVKLLANVTKLVAYPFHYLFPDKRFTIPERAAPWWRSSKPAGVKLKSCVWREVERVTYPAD